MTRPFSTRASGAVLLACLPFAAGCGGISEFLCADGGPNATCPIERRDPFADADSEAERPGPLGRMQAYVARVPAAFFGQDEVEEVAPAGPAAVYDSPVMVASATAAPDTGGPVSDLRTLLHEGDAALARGDHAAAADAFGRVVAVDPSHAVARHRLGVLADLRGEYAAADGHYEVALAGRPDDADLLNDVGFSHILRGRPADAAPFLEAALEKTPDHPRATANIRLVGGVERSEAAVRVASVPAADTVRSADRAVDASWSPDATRAAELAEIARPDETVEANTETFDDARYRAALAGLRVVPAFPQAPAEEAN
ncbi:MAG: hypothetical protein AAF532_12670 [Planctomycetota bacterium]